MIGSLLHQLFGYRRLYVQPEDTIRVLNLLGRGGFSHRNTENTPEGGISFLMEYRHAQAFVQICAEQNTIIREGRLRGLPNLIKRYRGRIGIVIGIIIFSCIVWLSTTVVWTIDITGNHTVPENEIRDLLRENGFSEGTRFGPMDFDEFQNRVLMGTDKLSFMAINMQGTTAHVEVRESVAGKSSAETRIANVVASEDGQIVEVRVSGGRAAVKKDDVVRAGELLISGIMSVREEGLRYEYASGSVIAQVHRRIIAEIPLSQEEKRYSGQEICKKSIIFFGKEIKLFQNGGFAGAKYDTIIENIRLTLPGGIELPIWLCTERQAEYETETVLLSESQAMMQAERSFSRSLSDLLEHAEILNMDRCVYTDGELCRITAELVCLTDIAATSVIPTS